MKNNIKCVCVAVFCALGLSAETVLNWQCDDGVSGTTAATITNVNGSAIFNGTADSYNGGAVPVFTNVVPAPKIWSSSFNGVLLNSNNTTSLRFTNAGLPGSANSAVGGKVYLNDVSELHLTNQTVEFFMKVDGLVDWSTVFGKLRSGGDYTWLFQISSADNLQFRVDTNPDGAHNQYMTGPYVADGEWHHMAFTYDDNTRVTKLYVDHEFQNQITIASNLVYEASPLVLGGGSSRAFDGWIDEVRISDAVLEPADFLTTNESFIADQEYVHLSFDGTPEEEAGQLDCGFYTGYVNAYGTTINGGISNPVYKTELPSSLKLRVRDGVNGDIINSNNDTSLAFLNSSATVSSGNQGSIVYMTDSSLPFAATNFTAEIFMRVDRAVSYSVIMAKKRAGGFSWAVNVLTSGELRVRMDTNLPGETDGFNKSFSPGADSQVEDGKWHHVALTYDAGTEQGEVFVDYESVGSFTSPVNPLYFDEGDYIIGAGDRAFDGWLDEFRLSGKVLAPDQFLRVVSEGGTVIVIY